MVAHQSGYLENSLAKVIAPWWMPLPFAVWCAEAWTASTFPDQRGVVVRMAWRSLRDSQTWGIEADDLGRGADAL